MTSIVDWTGEWVSVWVSNDEAPSYEEVGVLHGIDEHGVMLWYGNPYKTAAGKTWFRPLHRINKIEKKEEPPIFKEGK